MAVSDAAARGSPVCVLWHAPGVAPAGELVAALQRKGISIEPVGGPYAALAEVCRLGRGRRESPVILLLAEPARLVAASAVVELARMHAPRAICWVYAPGREPQLRGLADGDLGMPAGAPGPNSQARAANQAGPAVRSKPGGPPVPIAQTMGLAPAAPRQPAAPLRLTGEEVERGGGRADADSAGSPEGSREPAGQRPGAPTLTQEELAMLLAEDDPA